MYRSNREREKNLDRDEYGFRQTHGGRERFPSGEWGSSSEFGRNTSFRESDSYENRRRDRPFDMDNYYSGRQFSVGGMDLDREERDDEFSSREYDRSRFAEPYTGGQFSRSQYGRGSGYDHDYERMGRYSSYDREQSFSGKGPKGYKRSDERIKEEVCEMLFRSPMVDASDIEVSVKDGCVILRGIVDSRESKREAESCIENLSGVEDVQNELRLKKSAGDSGLSEKSNRSEQNIDSKLNRQSH